VPKSRRADPDAYRRELQTIAAEHQAKAVPVPQRCWGAASAASTRPWLCTTSLAPCVSVIAYEPMRRIGALAHIDRNNETSTVTAMLDEGIPGGAGNPLHIYFYGCYDLHVGEGSITGLLGAIYEWTATAAGAGRTVTIHGLDVGDRVHGTEILLDTVTGRLYPVGYNVIPNDSMTPGGDSDDKEFQGFPLDSSYRKSPTSDKYWRSGDGRDIAEVAENLPRTVSGDNERVAMRRMRCAWNVSQQPAKTAFVLMVNQIVCEKTANEAIHKFLTTPDGFFSRQFKADRPTRAAQISGQRGELVAALVAWKRPITIEQSLKKWLAQKETTREQRKNNQDLAGKLERWRKASLIQRLVDGMENNKLTVTSLLAIAVEWLAQADAWHDEGNYFLGVGEGPD
jgi:hypothetical protein